MKIRESIVCVIQRLDGRVVVVDGTNRLLAIYFRDGDLRNLTFLITLWFEGASDKASYPCYEKLLLCKNSQKSRVGFVREFNLSNPSIVRPKERTKTISRLNAVTATRLCVPRPTKPLKFADAVGIYLKFSHLEPPMLIAKPIVV